MRRCEIVYVKEGRNGKGWRWRSVGHPEGRSEASTETFPLFYECVMAARASGYFADIKCR